MERLHLELDLTVNEHTHTQNKYHHTNIHNIFLQRGLRLLILCIAMFFVVVYAAITESTADHRLGEAHFHTNSAIFNAFT